MSNHPKQHFKNSIPMQEHQRQNDVKTNSNGKAVKPIVAKIAILNNTISMIKLMLETLSTEVELLNENIAPKKTSHNYNKNPATYNYGLSNTQFPPDAFKHLNNRGDDGFFHYPTYEKNPKFAGPKINVDGTAVLMPENDPDTTNDFKPSPSTIVDERWREKMRERMANTYNQFENKPTVVKIHEKMSDTLNAVNDIIIPKTANEAQPETKSDKKVDVNIEVNSYIDRCIDLLMKDNKPNNAQQLLDFKKIKDILNQKEQIRLKEISDALELALTPPKENEEIIRLEEEAKELKRSEALAAKQLKAEQVKVEETKKVTKIPVKRTKKG